ATAPQAEDMRVLCEALARVGPAGAASQELLTTIAGQSHFAQVRRAAARAARAVRAGSTTS
ncbi:MAG: hypothetical protein ACRCZF_17975, partial [Gemmataceae bacterium]